MPSLYLVLFSFLTLSLLTFGQIVIPTSNTLLDASQNSSTNDTDLIKVYASIL